MNQSLLPDLADRQSLRALSDKPIDSAVMNLLWEAARSAPSAYNNQPWRLVYITRADVSWQDWVSTMVLSNQLWATRAPLLVAIVGYERFTYNHLSSRTYGFDTGAAWMALALQAHYMGLIAHAMEGFDYDALAAIIGLPKEHTLFCLVAIAYPATQEERAVIPDKILASDAKRTDRRLIADFCFHESFPEVY